MYRAGFAAFLLKRSTIFLKHSLLTVFIGHVGQTECDCVNDLVFLCEWMDIQPCCPASISWMTKLDFFDDSHYTVLLSLHGFPAFASG